MAKKCSWTYKKMFCVERSAQPSAYFQTRPLHFISSPPIPFLSFSLFLHRFFLAYAQAAYCTRTDGQPEFVQHPGQVLVSPSDRPFKPFIFLATCTRMNPYSGVPCLREPALPLLSLSFSLWADPIFSLMTHCPGEQSARMWIAYRPRIHNALKKSELNDYAYNLCLEYSNYYFVRNDNK